MCPSLWLPNAAQLSPSVLPLIMSWPERLLQSGIELCSGSTAYDSGKVKKKMQIKKKGKKEEGRQWPQGNIMPHLQIPR